ncbi:MAG: 2-dehydropantoate 2-reductase [Sphingomicrobium sp.]
MAAAKVAVFGAGSVGCYVGGAWAAAGLNVTLIGRERLATEVAGHGLTIGDYTGWRHGFAPGEIAFTTDPAALSDADIILVTVKGGSTAEAGETIARHGRDGATVVSFQNGVGNKALLESALGERFAVVQGMVPYNVIYLGDGRFHKGVAGTLFAEDVPAMRALAERVAGSREPLRLSPDMAGIAWGKLLINLNNAVNALSGRTLLEQLGERGYRRVVAASQTEALRLLRRAGIVPAKVGPLAPRLVPLAIGSPDWLFKHLFARRWKIDDKARSSMSDDLLSGRVTEVDQLNGEVVRLAESLGLDAPINRRIVALVRQAESGAPSLEPAALERAVLGR